MRELLILRHGKSDWSTSLGDFQRPLKKRGRKNAKQIGEWLLRKELVPEHVISSPAARALETAGLACTGMGVPESKVQEEPVVYGADELELLQVIRAAPKSAHRVLLVGHNPGMEDLVLLLAAGAVTWPEDGKLMPTAALARFRVSGAWAELSPGGVEFIEIVRARGLGDH